MAGVSLVNICKSYSNGFQAVKNFNLKIEEGEFLILVGPSGCGKSTTLRMIAGLDEISGGELWINDRLVNYLKPQERNLSMVFQNYALYPHMTVYQNMAFGLKVHGLDKEEIDKRVKHAAEILEISHLLDRRPNALSGGQKQRVAIGSVIVRQTDLLLMDEPLSNLDAKLRSQMRVELAKLHQKLGATIIYVTHDQVEAMTLGSRIVVMKDGEIQQADKPAELYNNPANKFVAGFIGSPTMNFIETIVYRVGNELQLKFGSQFIRVTGLMAKRLLNMDMEGRELTVGIRPEDFHLEGEEGTDIQMEIEVREMLGAEVLIHGESEKTPISAKLSPDSSCKAGECVRLYADVSQMKLFDTETGVNIFYTQEGER